MVSQISRNYKNHQRLNARARATRILNQLRTKISMPSILAFKTKYQAKRQRISTINTVINQSEVANYIKP
jgi:hypothetical protein